MKSYLHAVWEGNFQLILTIIDIGALVVLFKIVVDGLLELIYVLIFVLLWLSSNYLIFKGQQERIKQLEDSLATEQRSINSNRLLLKTQITQNLDALNAYLEKINRLGEPRQDFTQKQLDLAIKAIELPLPTWSFTIWETQTSILSRAVSAEELPRIQIIYGHLNNLTGIYSKLQVLMDEQQTNLRANRYSDGGQMQMGVPGPPLKFDQNAPTLWNNFEQIAHAIITGGNPL